MELNFKIDSRNEYKCIKPRKGLAILWGLAVILAGIFLDIIPRSLVLWGVNLAAEKELYINMNYIEKLMEYGYICYILGAVIIVVTIFFPYKKRIIVTKDNFIIMKSGKDKSYEFENVKKIVDYYVNGRREMKFHFKDKRQTLKIQMDKVVDYASLFHDLKEKHKNLVLSSSFPENIESVSFPVSKHVRIEKGHLVFKDVKVPFSKIQGFTIIQEEDTYNMGMQIAVSGMKHKIIKILPADIQNDDALYGVLSTISEENP